MKLAGHAAFHSRSTYENATYKIAVALTIAASSMACIERTDAYASEAPQPVNPSSPLSRESFYAIDLKCPVDNLGSLEFSMETPDGDVARIFVDYAGDLPVKVKMLVKDFGEPVATAIDVRIDAAMTEDARKRVNQVRSRSDQLYNNICLGTATEKRSIAP